MLIEAGSLCGLGEKHSATSDHWCLGLVSLMFSEILVEMQRPSWLMHPSTEEQGIL
jgi:hypothetical protein